MVALRLWPAIVLVSLLVSGARAADSPSPPPPPPLWEPAAAVSYLLSDPAPPAPPPKSQPAPSPRWSGSLPDGIVRTLFGSYRTLLSSQDMPVCGFSPSCSRFSQRAIARCGFLQGALLSIDRTLRDHPLAVGLYPPAGAGSRLLRDEPDRYCLSEAR